MDQFKIKDDFFDAVLAAQQFVEGATRGELSITTLRKAFELGFLKGRLKIPHTADVECIREYEDWIKLLNATDSTAMLSDSWSVWEEAWHVSKTLATK